MNESQLKADSDFIVKESRATNYVVGIVMVLVLFISLFIGDFGWGNYLDGLWLLLIPGAFFLARAKRNPTIIKINKSGFYYAGKKITDWEHFHSAVLSQDEKVGSIQDLFILVLEYYSLDNQTMYKTTIPLTNTQDKAEEEIVSAIDFYYKTNQATHTKNDLS